MKAVMIVHNLALTEKVEYTLEHFGVRGYTHWDNVKGSDHLPVCPTWAPTPARDQRGDSLTFVDDEKVALLLEAVRRIDDINQEVGIRAFVWSIEQTV
ncbi:MAG: hypothetical protein IPI74_00090 [Bacteroidales bacterium]|nr:hypothetical protein [Bacteroidales bacterium]